MLKLKKKHVVPPGGYRYYDPELKMKLEQNTLNQLVEEVTRLRKLNQYPIPENLKDIIEDWICQQIPDSFVIGDLTTKPKLSYIPVSTVRIATEKFLNSWRSMGKKVCAQQESVRRAAVCAECPENESHSSCLGCRGLISWVRQWTQRRTQYDSRLFVCKVFAVMNVCHIHASAQVLRRLTTTDMKKQLPEKCWRKHACNGG